jgi:hypothetical protein
MDERVVPNLALPVLRKGQRLQAAPAQQQPGLAVRLRLGGTRGAARVQERRGVPAQRQRQPRNRRFGLPCSAPA